MKSPTLSAVIEGGTQGLKACKIMPLHDFEPAGKDTFAVWVLFPKLA
jgi:hypothetical protein